MLFKPPWPLPLASICDNDQWVSPIPNKSCWIARGPALVAYCTIKDKIRSCIEAQGPDLFEETQESCIFYSICCLMIGREKKVARPYIAIFGWDKKVRQRFRKVIENNTWWLEFRAAYQGFGGFLLKKTPPKKMADLHMEHAMRPANWVYTSDQYLTLAGAPIFFTTDLLGPDDSCNPTQATLGGIVYIDTVPFGLTVAHALTKNLHGYQNGDSELQYDTEFEMDVSDDEEQIEFPGEKIVSDFSQDAKPSANFLPPLILHGKPKLVGKIFLSSSGSASDEADWALIALHLEGFREEQITGSWDLSLSIPTTPEQSAIQILSSNTSTKVPSGKLSTCDALIWFDIRAKCVSLSTVVLDKPVRNGDCGSWIVSPEGKWLGHLVAGVPGINMTWFARSSCIVADIQRRTGITLSVWPADNLHELLTFREAYEQWISRTELSQMEPQIESLLISSGCNRVELVRLLLKEVVDMNTDKDLVWRTAIQLATHEGHTEVVKLLLDAGVMVNAKHSDHKSPLQCAAIGGHAEIVKMLLQAGADPNASGGSYYSSQSNQSGVKVDKTSYHQRKIRGTAIDLASEVGHVEVVKVLLPYLRMTENPSEKLLQLLACAARSGNVTLVEVYLKCIEEEAPQNKQASIDNALVSASYLGQIEVVRLLIKEGTGIDAQGTILRPETDLTPAIE